MIDFGHDAVTLRIRCVVSDRRIESRSNARTRLSLEPMALNNGRRFREKSLGICRGRTMRDLTNSGGNTPHPRQKNVNVALCIAAR